ncbi:MAG: acyl-CoA dehydrogenase [Rhodospirillaceae bacterium]|nr:MAG: acyl-CoA dehydrogenase [Rhodospirillaceae bacterium]
MDFDLSEDEEILKGVVERFVNERYSMNQRRSYSSLPTGFSEENWALLGELGMIAAAYDVDDGGLGLGAVGLITIMKALGQGLAIEPLVENAVVGGGLFAQIAPPAVKAPWMRDLLSGKKRIALAHRERSARKNLSWVEAKAWNHNGRTYLSGEKSVVPAGEGVDAYLVTAQRDNGSPDISIFLVDAHSPGLSTRTWRLVDGTAAVSLKLDKIEVEPEHCLGGNLADIERLMNRAALLNSAEAIGIMDRMLSDTLDHLRIRKQFGVPLSSFQTLQHRMVGQYAVLEKARALVDLAAMTAETDGASWARVIQGARAYIAETSIVFGHEMIQMHGGMGITDELLIGQGHKRLLMLSRWPEEPVKALDRYAAAR